MQDSPVVNRSRRERLDCWLDTLKRAYAIPSDSSLRARPSTKHRLDDLPPADLSRFRRTQLDVTDEDAIDCGLEYLARGYNPVVLNLADDKVPAGCVTMGGGAQEESLFRRTALCSTLTLRKELYPIGPSEGIYSPDVAVFKTSETDGWKPIEPVPSLAFLSVPGLRYPQTGPGGRLGRHDETCLEDKVRLMLRIAAMHRHDCVVLGPSGCGEWMCPPGHVAEVFARVVAEHLGAFRVVTFAIRKGVDDTADARQAMGLDDDNHTVFRKAFGFSS